MKSKNLKLKKWAAIGRNNSREETDQDEIGNGPKRVGTLNGGDRLHTEVAAVTRESDPETELVCNRDRRIHLGNKRSMCFVILRKKMKKAFLAGHLHLECGCKYLPVPQVGAGPIWMDEAELHPAGSVGVMENSGASAVVESNRVVAEAKNNGASVGKAVVVVVDGLVKIGLESFPTTQTGRTAYPLRTHPRTSPCEQSPYIEMLQPVRWMVLPVRWMPPPSLSCPTNSSSRAPSSPSSATPMSRHIKREWDNRTQLGGRRSGVCRKSLNTWILHQTVLRQESAPACPNPPIKLLPVATKVWLRHNLNDDQVRCMSHSALIPWSDGVMLGPLDVLSHTCGRQECVDSHRLKHIIRTSDHQVRIGMAMGILGAGTTTPAPVYEISPRLRPISVMGPRL
ncbi:hypothetical protein PIB30_051632 [Stylosanthes scabra]|uniref:Uncharacterized protein n=1 Tax=Stylosanthes scabra TaxID=79078 RepID=A0ABU6UIB6_9FABA|nr:hypothetical protein [Stylosanthes scabra]